MRNLCRANPEKSRAIELQNAFSSFAIKQFKWTQLMRRAVILRNSIGSSYLMRYFVLGFVLLDSILFAYKNRE
jgi:hypothetical protein